MISAIIPVGNFGRDFNNLEQIVTTSIGYPIQLIIVNDSSDLTAEINRKISSWRHKDLVLLESKAKNPGGARNIGLNFAVGETIAFWDSDDLPDFPNIVLMNNLLIASEFDLLIGGYSKKNDNGSYCYFPPRTNSSKTLINPGLWRIIFKRELIKNLKFVNCKIGEDQIFLADVFNSSPKINTFNKSVYNYHKNVIGLTSSKTISNNYETTLKILSKKTNITSNNQKLVYFNLLASYIKRTSLANFIPLINILKNSKNIFGISLIGWLLKVLIIKAGKK